MHNDRIVQQLINGLTSRQLAELVARLLEGMSDTDRAEFSNTLDPDVAAVFRRLSDPPTACAPAEEANDKTSDAKFAAQFQSALGALRDLLSELGDEDGDYILCERHWEPPDFDASRLTEDIERCAKDLLPLLDRAATLRLEGESLFMDYCQEITDGIGHYPEHIYTEDGLWFERTATECVLKWLDLHAETEMVFLEKLVALLDGTGCVTLDDDTIRAYLIEGWTEKRRRAFYSAIEVRRADDEEFRRETDQPRTLWHDIRYALAGMFDVAARIEIAESAVSDDWIKGVELVDVALADSNSTRALEFCRQTLDAYYRHRSSGTQVPSFDPGTTPLLGHWGVQDDFSQISRILGIWADLSAKAGDKRLAELLAIQQVLFTRSDDWSAVRAAFTQAETADASTLLRAWKERTLSAQCGAYFLGMRQQDFVWPEWLIDEGFAERFDAFTEKARSWLDETIGTAKTKDRDMFRRVAVHVWPPQMSLVAELFALGLPSGDYPILRAMLSQHCRLNPCPARLEWLGRTDIASLAIGGLGFVQRNMVHLIPSPETMSSDYGTAASWLAVAREVAPGIALSTLQRWKTDYRRRRNLWRDLSKHGFDVDLKS